jgi:acyl-ACP thioesterase
MNKMKHIWQEETSIKAYEVDFKNKLKISSIFNYMQEAAGNHAEHLGIGYDALAKAGLFWILSRMKVSISRYPAMGEKVSIETWPKGIDRLVASRDFIFTDGRGQELGAAATLWLLLDAKTMKPKRIQALPVPLPENRDKHGLEEALEKIELIGASESITERVAGYSDIDVNNHVNNAKYVEWILDCFSNAFFAVKQVKSLQVNFISETKQGDEVMIQKVRDSQSSDCYYLEGVHKTSQKKIFQSKIEWI